MKEEQSLDELMFERWVWEWHIVLGWDGMGSIGVGVWMVMRIIILLVGRLLYYE